MALTQRQANIEALKMAAAMFENADLETIFADLGEMTLRDDQILAQAKKYALKRLNALVPKVKRN